MGHLHRVGGSPRWPLMVRAAITSLSLSAAFIVLYGGTNWLTAQRPAADVGVWLFEWELTAIPYVPWLIVPYMSIDLFFFMAPFLCRNRLEMKVFVRRVVFSLLVAIAFFLLMPLRLTWPERPRVSGTFGDFVEASCTAPFLMEYPHNLFPALHITFCMIVGEFYARHSRGLIKTLLILWFILIGVSTILTWQHHLPDLAGGAMLAGFAFYLFNEATPRLPVTPNVRVGSYYAAGAVLTLAPAPLIWPWGVFLLWPTSAFTIVALGYFGLGPGIYRKTEGRLSWSTRFVLASVLIGQYLSLLYYRRQCRAWDEVAPGVLVGRVLNASEADTAIKQGVTAVLDLTAEFSAVAPIRMTNYRNLPILDLTAPTQNQLRDAVAFITDEAAKGIVYIHCKVGYSRSVAVAGTYLLATERATNVEDAIAQVVRARPSSVIRPEILTALQVFAIRESALVANR